MVVPTSWGRGGQTLFTAGLPYPRRDKGKDYDHLHLLLPRRRRRRVVTQHLLFQKTVAFHVYQERKAKAKPCPFYKYEGLSP